MKYLIRIFVTAVCLGSALGLLGCARGDVFLPTISDFSVSGITEDSAIITWSTDHPSTSSVEYGRSGYEFSSAPDENLTTSHTVALGGLTPSTEYRCRAVSATSGARAARSWGTTFTTKPDFRLPSYAFVDDAGWPAMEVSFTTTGEVKLGMVDPHGILAGSGSAGEAATGTTACRVTLRMGDYETTPVQGKYTMTVTDSLDDEIFSETFDFAGANAAISDVVTYWGCLTDQWYLDRIQFVVKNRGDLPVCIWQASLDIGAFHSEVPLPEVILPGGEEYVIISDFEINGLKPEEQPCTLVLTDRGGGAACSYSSSVVPQL